MLNYVIGSVGNKSSPALPVIPTDQHHPPVKTVAFLPTFLLYKEAAVKYNKHNFLK